MSRASFVRGLFERITPRYELVNILLSLGMCYAWRRRTVQEAHLAPGDRALDVCTGTGEIAALLAAAVGPQGHVTGLDFCAPMLVEARRQFARYAWLDFVEGDAHQLPSPDGQWKAVTMAFGLRNLDDPEKSLRDIYRVLQPGGRVLVLELTRPQVFGLKQLYGPYLRYVVPLVGGLLSGDWNAYRYLSNSISAFMGVPAVLDIMRQVGFRDGVSYPLSGGMHSDGGDPMSRTLIAHADDFNLTDGVSAGIVAAYRDGIVRSTSVMANLPGLSHNAELLRANPGLDIGVHFNLTLGSPLSQDVPSLVGDNGHFRKRAELHADAVEADDVRRELIAQISAVQSMGLKVTHVDTHHHIHENERIANVIRNVVSTMSLAMRSYGPDMVESLRKLSVPTPKSLIVKFYGDQDATLDMLLGIIRELPEGVSELCCHPAMVDDALRAISSYTEPRARELQILCSDAVRTALAESEVRLASYADAFK